MKSQTQLIFEHLIQGKTITGAEAYSRFGCFRLAARISDLKKAGHKNAIGDKTIKQNGKYWAMYYIKPKYLPTYQKIALQKCLNTIK